MSLLSEFVPSHPSSSSSPRDMVFAMSSLPLALALLFVVVVAEPALPGENAYLPPVQGYPHSTPAIPFYTPTRPPTYTPTRPPTYTTRPPTRPPTSLVTPDYNIVTRPPITPIIPHYTPPPPTGYTPSRPVGPPVTPTYGPPPTQNGHDHGDGHVHMPGMPFDFEYAVKDDQYGNDYSHKANSNGDVVQGEYRVQLPDGRLQIVRYTADWATGFHADVQYEGQARYPDQQQPGGGYNYQQPTPSGSRPGY